MSMLLFQVRILSLLWTGSYQLPAVLCPGLTLVVSPLVSHMEDQLLAVINEAATLNTSSSQSEVSRVQPDFFQLQSM